MKAGFFRTMGFFFNIYRRRTVVVIGLLVLSGLAEAVGVASFLPLLQIILEGKDAALSDGYVAGKLMDFGILPTFPVIAGMIVTAMVLKAAMLWSAMRYVSVTVAKVSGDLRMKLLRGLVHADWQYFVTHTLGASLNSMATESFQAAAAFVSASRFFASLIQFSIYAIGALLVSWMVFAGGIVIGGLIILTLWSLVRIARRAGKLQTQTAKALLTQLADMLQGIKPLRAMALEDKFIEIIKRQSRGLQEAQANQLASTQSMRIFNEPLMMIAGVAGLYLAVTYGNLESSSLVLMGILFMRLLTSMNACQNEYQRLASQEDALWSLNEAIAKAQTAHQNWPGKNAVPDPASPISLKNISFWHSADKPLLQDITLDFPAKSFVALIGPSGSGKTSILDLICGFYRPQGGRIEVAGHPIDTLDLNLWRKSVGFVPQEVYLFNDTVVENIRVGRDIPEDDVYAALKAAGADEFVAAMPDGIHSSVGENGRKLSGGQRQRVAIARAIVGHPKFLLLDEATSALDPATEENLLTTLKDLSREMTVIFVSHNRAILNYADIVYQISDGEILQKAA